MAEASGQVQQQKPKIKEQYTNAPQSSTAAPERP